MMKLLLSSRTVTVVVLALATALLVVNVNGFGVPVPHVQSTGGSRRSFIITTQLSAVTVSPPPPPSTPLASAIVKDVTPNTNKQAAISTVADTKATSNLPSQKELASKTASASSTPSPKSTNVASGSGIVISDIHFDGDVPKTEADEYVVITNNSNKPMDISGYYIYVATSGTQGATYTFPKGTTSLKPNQSVRIYTNEVHKDTGGYTFGSGKAIWSNNGGLGVLKDNNGKKLMEYKYNKSS
jgi:hypothetical protein